MNQYYVMECYVPDDLDDIARLKAVYVAGLGSWRLGKRFTANVPSPLMIKIKEGYPDTLKVFYNNDALVMTQRLHAALLACGVDNMDTYPCVILNEETGFQTDDYVAVNLVGLVGTNGHTDQPETGAGLLDDLSLEGRLMFRLEHNTSAVVVHHSVKESLQAQGFDMLTFETAESWIG